VSDVALYETSLINVTPTILFFAVYLLTDFLVYKLQSFISSQTYWQEDLVSHSFWDSLGLVKNILGYLKKVPETGSATGSSSDDELDLVGLISSDSNVGT